jgi:hypothetical protein
MKCLFSIAPEVEKVVKAGGVSWAKTCALVIHIWIVAHKWKGEQVERENDEVSPRYTRQMREPGATDVDVSVCRATLARPMRAGATDALSQRQQTWPRALFQRLTLWNCAGVHERERQTFDAASVGLAAYASDELGRKHRH